MKKRGNRVLVIGYHGMGNVGAELRLKVIIEDIKKANPQADITIATFRYHPLNIIRGVKYLYLHNVFTSVFETILRLHKFDYVICGEGIPFVDFCGPGFIDYFIPILEFAHKLGKKTACYSFDLDSLNKRHRRRVIRTLKKVDLLIPRTKETYGYLKKYGVKDNLHLGTDTSLLFKTDYNRTCNDKIGFCLKDFYCYPIKFRLFGKRRNYYHYPYYYTYKNKGKLRYKKFVEQIAGMIDGFMEENKRLRVSLIVMEDQMDYKTSKDVYNLIKKRKRVELISRRNYSIKSIIDHISDLDCLVAARYHAVILGVRHRVPTFVLSTDERFDYFIKELGLKRFLIDVYKEKINTKELAKFIDNHKCNKEIFSEKISHKLPILKRRAEHNYKYLIKFFNSP